MIVATRISVVRGGRRLLDDVSLEIPAGAVTAVIGANGAGKTTLRKVLSGDLKPDSGSVEFAGRAIADWPTNDFARRRAVLPQDSRLEFPFTVEEVVMMGRAPHIARRESVNDRAIVREALALVDAVDLENRVFTTLSGGERQRVQLARVLAQIWEPEGERFLFLDEPTSNLDLRHQHQVLGVARCFAADSTGVFVVLHDLNLAARYADRVVLLKDGRALASGRPADVLTPDLVREALGVEIGLIPQTPPAPPVIIWAGSRE